jgi:hypothetical protein
MALCITGGALAAHLAINAFTLSWMHTIEKVPWEEQWRVEPTQLLLTQARIKGSGAGMEPPPDAKLDHGWYVWQPANGARDQIVLRLSGIGTWTFCAENIPCAPLQSVLGGDADPITLKPCA